MASRPQNFAEYVVRIFLLIGSVLLLSERGFAQHYPILPVPGAPHGIFTMMQDSQSALWLGTIDDVFRFDGEHFYSLRQYGFPKETPNSFAEDGDGGIWIATQGTDAGGGTGRGGLYRYQSGHVTKVFAGDGLSVVSVAPGAVLASIGTEIPGKPAFGDLVLFRRGSNGWKAEPLLAKQANHLTVDHQGNVLFPCPRGWCEIARQDLEAPHADGSQLRMSQHSGSPLIERVLRDKFGCVWFRAEAFSSYQCPTDPQPKLVPHSISAYDSSAHLEETSDGSIFMLVRLALGRPGVFQIANSSDGIPADMDTAMVARDGTIWIGGDRGLYRFMYPFELKVWDRSDGIQPPASILREGKEIFTSGGGLRRLESDGRRWAAFGGPEGIGAILAAGPLGTLFAASQYSIVQVDRRGSVIASGSIPNPDLSYRLTAGPDGDLWLGHRGVSRVIRAGSRLILRPEMKSDRGTSDIEYDQARNIIWACDGNDLVFLKNGNWGRISQKDGLLNLPCRTIGVQTDGDLWLGYGAAALAWIREPTSGRPIIKNYDQWLNEEVANDEVKLLSTDHRGWIWRVSDANYVAAPGGAENGKWLRLNEQDGLPPPPIPGFGFAAEDDGSIWLSTLNGVAHFSPPETFATDFPAPPVFIAGFSAGQGSSMLANATGNFSRNADLSAYVGSLQFDRRNALHIRYRLLPEQAAWTDTDNLDLYLGKLGWGGHELQVQAQLATGPWSAVESDSFTILKPLWFTWPALGGYVVLAGAVLAGGRRWRKKQVELERRAFPKVAEWRLAALSPELQHLDGALLDSRFEVGRILARGGFATVTEGRDLNQNGRRCAIKIFRQEVADKEWIARRFHQEVLALEQIHHPNVVRIFGSGTTAGGSFYLVMEYIEGETLRELLEIGRLAPERIARYLQQAGSALDQIHRYGICHRDLKPENLMIRTASAPEEELVLIDFSIAIVKDPDETLHGLSRAAGTIYYMAPEQVIGYADSSTDIYSLAKILIEMLSGQRLSALLPNASMDLPDRVRELLGELKVGLSQSSIELIGSALEFDPARRPKSAAEFAERIAQDLGRG